MTIIGSQPKIVRPIHPEGKTCDQCFHWLQQSAAEVYVDPNTGQAYALAQIMAMGGTLTKFVKITGGKCTAFPLWQNVVADSWCTGFFKERAE